MLTSRGDSSPKTRPAAAERDISTRHSTARELRVPPRLLCIARNHRDNPCNQRGRLCGEAAPGNSSLGTPFDNKLRDAQRCRRAIIAH